MIIYSDAGMIDDEIGVLDEIIKILDTHLEHLYTEIRRAHDLDADGLCDRTEHFIGLGFVSCQKYFTSTYGPAKFGKQEALKIGPMHTENFSVAQIIDATANYWKHHDEWNTTGSLREIHSEWVRVMLHIKIHLPNQAKNTLQLVESATPSRQYICSNVLGNLTENRAFELRSLMPLMVKWRDEFAEHLTR